MSRYNYVIVPEIDDEAEFRVPPQDYDHSWYDLSNGLYKISLMFEAQSLYEQYLIEYLSGLTQKTAEEWIDQGR